MHQRTSQLSVGWEFALHMHIRQVLAQGWLPAIIGNVHHLHILAKIAIFHDSLFSDRPRAV
jgi:hypothetical protein